MTSGSDDAGRGAQTLLRGLDVLDLVGRHGPITLKALTERTGLTRSTTHRLASALVERRMLRLEEGGYVLGPKLLRLDAIARSHMDLTSLARPHLERLAREQLDPVNLATPDGERLRYIDQVRGFRRIEVRPVIGETRWLAATGLGKAMLLDASEETWRSAFRKAGSEIDARADAEDLWIARMRAYRSAGAAFDIEENSDRVRCVAAPIRGANGEIVAALSLSSLPQYMTDERMSALVEPVLSVARAISAELGWRG